MSMWSNRAAWLLAGSIALTGCGKKTEPAITPSGDSAQATPESPTTSIPTPASKIVPMPLVRDAQHQAFADAVRNSDDPPADADRPPDTTVTKKPVHRILEQVRATWDAIRFVSPNGKKLAFSAVVDTNYGALEIALFPEQAPNHVRNFIALAQAGYYDQLFFERARHDMNTETKQEVHMLEGGCPLGTGQTGTGSIGYWLKQEFTPGEKMSHEEGTVGACRAQDADTAATRFYINLTKAPFLDGNYTIFGKVVQGLPVLRKMAKEPVEIDAENISRPQKPIVIQRVTILAGEVEAEKK